MECQLTRKSGSNIRTTYMIKLKFFLYQPLLIAICTYTLAQSNPKTEEDNYRSPSSPEIPLQEIADFVKIFNKIKNDYVESLSDREIMEKAFHGMASQLDPHSAFLSKENYAQLKENTSGKFGGIGVEIGSLEKEFIIIAPIDNGPAAKAGVLAGDIITKIDNSPVRGLGIADLSRRIKGLPGSTVTLTIEREGEKGPIQLKVSREIIDNDSVTTEAFPLGIIYLRISQFQKTTGKELERKFNKITERVSEKPRGIILDLRNNPGGVLNSAVEVSDAFLQKGAITFTKGRQSGSNQKFFASERALAKRAPLLVLINEGSASASEIVAGALQDNERAIIAGRQSFGKGSIQTIHKMRDNTALKLTTAFYYTPNGRSIQATGITPDIFIENLSLNAKEKRKTFGEADLDRHITTKEGSGAPPTDFDFKGLAARDFELYQATKILRTIMLIKGRTSTFK